MSTVKKRKKLLAKIALILIPIFTCILLGALYVVYVSTIDGYLEAKNTHMTYLLNTVSNNSVYIENDDEFEWYLDQWEKHPERLSVEVTDADFQAFSRFYDKWAASRDDTNSDIWNLENLKNAPEEIQDYAARSKIQNTHYGFAFESMDNNYELLFLIDLNEDSRGLILSEYAERSLEKGVGDYYDLDLSDHPAIQKMLDNNSDDIVFEKVFDFPEKGNYYIGYKPVLANGKVVAAMGIVYNWEEFQQNTRQTVRQMAVLFIGGILIAMLILFYMLYRSAVLPVKKIQSGVREYIETQDSEAVISKMAEIKQKNEFGFLAKDISDLAKAIDRYTEENTKLTSEREKVAAELGLATQIQAEQLPSTFPAFPDRKEFDIYASMTPAKQVGGDFYDFFLVDDDHLAMVIADVSGKGIPAALFMMMSKILINNYAMMGLSPSEIFESANRALCKNNDNKMFVTVWLGILEISTGKITAANAGHEYPIIRQPGGEFELLKDKHGFVLGGMDDMKFKEYEFTLQKGGTLFVYTDGVPEATDANNEMFKTQRLLEKLNEMQGASPQQLLEGIHSAVNDFVGDAPQFDDLTMLGITLSE